MKKLRAAILALLMLAPITASATPPAHYYNDPTEIYDPVTSTAVTGNQIVAQLGQLTVVTAGSVTYTQLPLSTTVQTNLPVRIRNATTLLQRVGTIGGDVMGTPTVVSGTFDVMPGETATFLSNGAGIWALVNIDDAYGNEPALTYAQANAMIVAGMQSTSFGHKVFVTDGLDVGESATHGTGVSVTLKQGASGVNWYRGDNTVLAH